LEGLKVKILSGFKAGDSNLYRYVRNSPAAFTDPTGLDGGFGTCPWQPWGGPPQRPPCVSGINAVFPGGTVHPMNQPPLNPLQIAGIENAVPVSYIDEIIEITQQTKPGRYPRLIEGGTTNWCEKYANTVYKKINAKYRTKGKPGIKTMNIVYWNIQGLGAEDHTTVEITFDNGSKVYIDADYAVPGTHIFSEKCLKKRHPDWTQK
jgi:hypothetical protein